MAIGNNVLITFNMLMDTDIGLFKVIKEKYYDPDVFNDKLSTLTDNQLKGLLQENESKNPLAIIMDNTSIEQMDAYYNEFMKSEYEDIIKNSAPTTMVSVVSNFINSSAIKVEILCATQLEYNTIQDLMKDERSIGYRIILEPNRSELDISLNDTIFIKYMDELFEFENVSGKNIMCADYLYNLDIDLYKKKQKSHKKEYMLLFAPNNELYTITMYYYDESYYMDLDNEQEETTNE